MRALLGIGTNLGDREENLAGAFSGLEKLPGTRLLAISNIYETAPFDVLSEQGDYLNCCVLIETGLTPIELLHSCLELEAGLGRVRREYHGARTMDIDLLVCEGAESCTEELTLPHPGILERAFVMVPMSDIFPGRNALGLDFAGAYEAVDKSGVRLYK
ncbi:MAG: 2-amino-4-hydroxy-6-hydroxymethyldihydropteridine diphosphokinase [Acutalibacter sp.]|jgi:2-amino-4-hydroxy-6-hydroxymethyldihydropteridine diphosphokinase|uniref:2-amino-4-hydroxy-6- hydroxymethyldihydropteridine diphosphokinase n=1 Tax=unclassified Acutalibacter TaxID=2620728 RepID=UPI00216EA4C0|nr:MULTISPECIES: 2-amino-4-hydroxy-6-hydroxymethyldihydropteridine diphosphokinase [unclassified Acutalibacter]MCI9225383.1 2-amino-4-hydroxy-6-hydroxymethyldihydropteridine diphosphokinase [Acutalibacter sp.]